MSPLAENWHVLGACRDKPPAWFFPDNHVGLYREAREVCAACPVRQECLQEALETESGDRSHRFGMWGGLTPQERASMSKRRKRIPSAGHGTQAKYRAGCHCQGCREAHRSYQSQFRSSERAAI